MLTVPCDGYPLITFSPNGKQILLHDRGGVTFWDVSTGNRVLTVRDYGAGGRALIFSPDGKKIANNNLEIWDATLSQKLLTLRGHSRVKSVTFSPDSRRIASGSQDHTTKIWDVESGRELLTLRGHTDQVTAVVFSPDGRRIATVSADETVRIWDATTVGKGLDAGTISAAELWASTPGRTHDESELPSAYMRQLQIGDPTDFAAVAELQTSVPSDWHYHPALVLLFALEFSQVSLVALWFTFSGRPLLWRVAAVNISILLWGAVLARVPLMLFATLPLLEGGQVTQNGRLVLAQVAMTRSVTLALAQVVIVVLSAQLVRAAGLGLARRCIRAAPSRPSMPGLSLAKSALWTACAIACLGLLIGPFFYDFLPPYLVMFVRAVPLSIAHAGIALIGLWTALGRQWLLLRVAALSAVVGAHALGLTYGIALGHMAMPSSETLLGHYVVLCLSHVALMVGPIYILRLKGYRLVWRGASEL